MTMTKCNATTWCSAYSLSEYKWHFLVFYLLFSYSYLLSPNAMPSASNSAVSNANASIAEKHLYDLLIKAMNAFKSNKK